jgi:hypothetical protein
LRSGILAHGEVQHLLGFGLAAFLGERAGQGGDLQAQVGGHAQHVLVQVNVRVGSSMPPHLNLFITLSSMMSVATRTVSVRVLALVDTGTRR